MYVYLFLIFISRTYSQQYYYSNKNHTSFNPSYSFDTFSGRQHEPPSVEPFVEQFKPSGYTYPNPPKLQTVPDNKLRIYLLKNKFSIYCATDSVYEQITWRRYMCPNQIGEQPGDIVAINYVVSNSNLYGINNFARNEEYISELLLKQPLVANSDGAFVCEGTFLSNKYPYEDTVTIKDIIIIGGKGMYQNCFQQHKRISSKRSMNETHH